MVYGGPFKRDVQRCSLSIVAAGHIDKIVQRFHVISTSPSPAAASCRLKGKGDNEGQGDWVHGEGMNSLMCFSVMSRPDIATTSFAR